MFSFHLPLLSSTPLDCQHLWSDCAMLMRWKIQWKLTGVRVVLASLALVLPFGRCVDPGRKCKKIRGKKCDNQISRLVRSRVDTVRCAVEISVLDRGKKNGVQMNVHPSDCSTPRDRFNVWTNDLTIMQLDWLHGALGARFYRLQSHKHLGRIGFKVTYMLLILTGSLWWSKIYPNRAKRRWNKFDF